MVGRRIPSSAHWLRAYCSTSCLILPPPTMALHSPPCLFQPLGNPASSCQKWSERLDAGLRKPHVHGRQAADEEGFLDSYGRMLHRYVGSSSSPPGARSLQLELTKLGFVGDLFLSNTLVNLYAKSGNLTVARQVFDEMPHRNAVSWTCLISGHSQWGQPDEACRLFRSMVSAGFPPSEYTFGSVLRGCQDSGPRSLPLGAQVHGVILKSGYSLDPVACNALISMYGSCSLDSMVSVRRIFEGAPKGNLVSWNSIISVCSQKGEAPSAYELFLAMQRSDLGLRPNGYTFGSLISATYACPAPRASLFACLLDQLLSQILKSGFLEDLYVGSALVSAFARLGVLDRAKKTFLQMQKRNAVSMNGLMVGLVKQKQGEEAADIFRQVNDPGLVNEDTFVVLLSACAEFSAPEAGKRTGREIHGFITRNSLGDDKVAVGNGLVNMYAKCSAIEEARRVFELMGAKDQVSWNSIISGFDQNGLFQEALTSFRKMRIGDASPSNFTLISTLSSCSSLAFLRFGEQVHCDGVKAGLDLDISVSNALLTMYGDCGQTSESQRVFWSMPDHDLVSWNSMIGVLADSETHLPQSMGVFREMLRGGWHPNRVTFINILVASSSLSLVNQGRQAHALVVKHGLSEDVAVENAMLSCYARSGCIGASEQLFILMSGRRDNLSWNSMVAGYVDNGLLPEAMDLVWLMMNDGQKLDNFTFATVLSGCAAAGALERGTEMHGFRVRSQVESDVVVESTLVDMYSKCGRVNYAARVFAAMPSRNRYSWNSMISGCARHGDAAGALRLFREMQLSQRPDDVTFVSVLSACSHAGLVEEGLQYFDDMAGSYGVEPRMEHYSCVVDLLGRAGMVEEMESFLRRMPMEPNALIWRTVLAACCRTKDRARMALGGLAGEKLMELEPENPVSYVLMSKLFASVGKWEDVARARSSMRTAMVRKEAGCSWVTLKDGVHTFVAGDRSHPEAEEVYRELLLLIQRTRVVGYAPQTGSALYDLDSEEKELLLSHHSEKLALAFVLIRSSSGLPIRIMKNLRVCGDCHLFFRCSSQVVGREIILRDSIRFHHFANGRCSCGDYW
ncbi:unnamed protein product [Spirodela intermedia]|uniref:DYW domain-containing protein n=1 Tax=Spirodela intermedia TaxID=51605 RepID=A0A7I8KZA8_SPIIN|nr:unnamed protein product [Spirodela intermedia]